MARERDAICNRAAARNRHDSRWDFLVEIEWDFAALFRSPGRQLSLQRFQQFGMFRAIRNVHLSTVITTDWINAFRPIRVFDVTAGEGDSLPS